MNEMCIVAAGERDWQTFLTFAAAEEWRVPRNEIAFHRRPGCVSAYALRRGEETIGFVTAVPHRKSGWIGNLLIKTSERGNGFGTRLFDTAVDRLMKSGVRSLWLTASRQGEVLYRRRGFHPYARVSRWVKTAGGKGESMPVVTTAMQGITADREVWQESRKALLTHLSANNSWRGRGGSIALLQRGERRQIIGPWLKIGDENAFSPLLEELVAVAVPGKELVIDLIERPETRKKLLSENFTCAGETVLMAAGQTEDVRLDRLYALASLGSIG